MCYYCYLNDIIIILKQNVEKMQYIPVYFMYTGCLNVYNMYMDYFEKN